MPLSNTGDRLARAAYRAAVQPAGPEPSTSKRQCRSAVMPNLAAEEHPPAYRTTRRPGGSSRSTAAHKASRLAHSSTVLRARVMPVYNRRRLSNGCSGCGGNTSNTRSNSEPDSCVWSSHKHPHGVATAAAQILWAPGRWRERLPAAHRGAATPCPDPHCTGSARADSPAPSVDDRETTAAAGDPNVAALLHSNH